MEDRFRSMVTQGPSFFTGRSALGWVANESRVKGRGVGGRVVLIDSGEASLALSFNSAQHGRQWCGEVLALVVGGNPSESDNELIRADSPRIEGGDPADVVPSAGVALTHHPSINFSRQTSNNDKRYLKLVFNDVAHLRAWITEVLSHCAEGGHGT